MTEIPRWEEAESQVHVPGLWPAFLAISVFLASGGLLAVGCFVRGAPIWTVGIGSGIFVLGAIVLADIIRCVISPVYVRHAATGTLPDVPNEPVLLEGSVVHGRLTHELVQVAEGWQFRPLQTLWRIDKCFLLGFGILFLAIFSGLVSWTIHHEANTLGWPVSIALGISIALSFGGTTFLLMFLLMDMVVRAGRRLFCWLDIPQSGDSLELDAPEEIDPRQAELTAVFKQTFLGEPKRRQLTIPRGSIRAVQLCPWEFALGALGGKETARAVQGLLVLQTSAEGTYCRLPLLLTSDFAGAAGLMQRLATTLGVPYLFHADAAGWQAELAAAKRRPPLRAGGC
jgi:hypothetical protein